jgi:hypothetical protein
VTLTAASLGAVHTIRAAGRCHPRNGRRRECQHGKPLWCDQPHRDTEVELGQPLCCDCYDYIAHVLFSWHAPELSWHFTIRLRRQVNRELRRRGEQPEQPRISFMKVLELQRRALPHFHAVIRLDAPSEPGQPPASPDTTVSAQDFVFLVRRAAINSPSPIPARRQVRAVR